MFPSTCQRWSHRPSRRIFLRVGTAGLAGLSLNEALRLKSEEPVAQKAPQAANVIMVFLTGGPSTIDMWDMKPDAPDAIRGEFKPRETSVAGIQICEHMPHVAQAMKLLTLVRSVSHTIAEHTQGQSYVMTGNAPSPSVAYPSLGSLTAKLCGSNRGMPAYATLGNVPARAAGDLGTAFDPFAIAGVGEQAEKRAADTIGLPDGFTAEDLARRVAIRNRIDRRLDGASSDLPAQLDRFQSEAVDILLSDKVNQALCVEKEPESVRDTYGRSSFGLHALAARRLIEAGARFVTIGFGDWDTHANNFTRLRQTLLPQLDQGLAALLTDLQDRGKLDETIVYCTGEFGRTPGVNSTSGRDHWARAMTSLVAGGGFHRGRAYGSTDSEGFEPASGRCSPDDLSATILEQLGFPPSHAVSTRSGRPIPIFKKGNPVAALTGSGAETG
ncbi:MAG TPA: DUF1501 domain-containing protein [Pirellulales bacterium]|nr:DUF1501 domain-containing protein [Pirellulales bacterium]